MIVESVAMLCRNCEIFGNNGFWGLLPDTETVKLNGINGFSELGNITATRVVQIRDNKGKLDWFCGNYSCVTFHCFGQTDYRFKFSILFNTSVYIFTGFTITLSALTV